ncbi:MAG: GIY-YIG nuclease family protein [Bacteroidota bacterium]
MYFLYIIYSQSKDKYYIGQTIDLDSRFKRHNSKRVASTKFGVPWILVYCEQFQSRKEAVTREVFLKSPSGWLTLKEIKETHRNVAQPG